MAINVRLDRIFPGMGQTFRNDAAYLLSGVALTTAASPLTTNLPAVAGLAFTAGRVRVKLYNGGTGATFTDLVVNATDGAATAWIGAGLLHPTVAVPLTTNWIEFEFEFVLDVATSGAGGFANGPEHGRHRFGQRGVVFLRGRCGHRAFCVYGRMVQPEQILAAGGHARYRANDQLRSPAYSFHDLGHHDRGLAFVAADR